MQNGKDTLILHVLTTDLLIFQHALLTFLISSYLNVLKKEKHASQNILKDAHIKLNSSLATEVPFLSGKRFYIFF
jgi:hypothetical protein